jgi:hypothetical protein
MYNATKEITTIEIIKTKTSILHVSMFNRNNLVCMLGITIECGIGNNTNIPCDGCKGSIVREKCRV